MTERDRVAKVIEQLAHNMVAESVQNLERAFIYGAERVKDPEDPRPTCCQEGGAIEHLGSGGWHLIAIDPYYGFGPLNFCPWCGTRLPEKP